MNPTKAQIDHVLEFISIEWISSLDPGDMEAWDTHCVIQEAMQDADRQY